jgi:integrase
LEVDEVQRLWDETEGVHYLIWRVLLMTGTRIGEVLALERADILPEGLRVDESALNGEPSTTKNKGTRVAPLPASLRTALAEWLTTHDQNLIFPSSAGRMHRRTNREIRELLDRGRSAAKIPDLTFRMCRTTFATLFDGDIKDAQAILGHHDASFTLRVYRRPVASRQSAAIEALDKKLNVVPIKQTA